MNDRQSIPASARLSRIEPDLAQNLRPGDHANPRPASVYHLVVLGAGPAGEAAARMAAASGAKVAIVERDVVGGNRLIVGCVPSKTMLRTARLYADMRDAETYGGRVPSTIPLDFGFAMERVRRVQRRISRYECVTNLAESGVDVFFGEGRFASRDTLVVGDATLRFKKAVIATGSRPVRPSATGLVEAGYFTNETMFDLETCPQRLMVVGGGPLGCESAQTFCRFGARVTIAQKSPMFLDGEERDAAQILATALQRDGVDVHLNTTIENVRVANGEKHVDLLCAGARSTIVVDDLLVGIGRAPNVENIGLEAAGVEHDAEIGVEVNDLLETSNSKIYAAGDVCLKWRFTHTAEASARIAVHNALFPGRSRMSALTIPWCTYTDPEIAHVGLYVRDAIQRGLTVRTITILMHDVDRAIADSEEEGFVKVHLLKGSDRILGATIVARHAGEMINELSLAIHAGIGLEALANVVHAYPTQAEAIKMTADAYVRTRQRPVIDFLAKSWLKMEIA